MERVTDLSSALGSVGATALHRVLLGMLPAKPASALPQSALDNGYLVPGCEEGANLAPHTRQFDGEGQILAFGLFFFLHGFSPREF